MKTVFAAILLVLSALPAFAGDWQPWGFRAPPEATEGYSPHRNKQAQAVAASRQCWRTCQTQCAAELQICGHELPGAECLPRIDACDRACQRSCRFTGDPLLDFFE